MLFRHDMFHMERHEERGGLGNAAILTRIPGAIPNQFADSLIQFMRPGGIGHVEPSPALCKQCRRPRQSLYTRHPRRT